MLLASPSGGILVGIACVITVVARLRENSPVSVLTRRLGQVCPM